MTPYNISVIGLGYVGLPLAVEFSKYFNVIGYDINSRRVSELNNFNDQTHEVPSDDLKKTRKSLIFTSDKAFLEQSNFYIITVPTPINTSNDPDLSHLIAASKLVGSVLKTNDFVVFESTVFPGATREVCVPELESHSGLKLNSDFFVGYSPERINPGDTEHRLPDIIKVVSGSNEFAAKVIDSVYSVIIKAGTHIVSTIEIAEAAKVIENTQRDLNIALVNELSLIFNKMNIDTKEVIDAASTKWNFSKFYPGLVGGHCIGVDPFYLTYKAKTLGYDPKVILAGRALNDSMPANVVKLLEEKFVEKNMELSGSNILILGFTFKENCPDTRNSKVVDLISAIHLNGANAFIYDPVMDLISSEEKYPNFNFIDDPKKSFYDAIIISVSHDDFKDLGESKIKSFLKDNKGVIVDIKSTFDSKFSDLRL